MKNLLVSLFLSINFIYCTEDKSHRELSLARDNAIDFLNDDTMDYDNRLMTLVGTQVDDSDFEISEDETTVETVARCIENPDQFRRLAEQSRGPEKLCWDYFKKVYKNGEYSLDTLTKITKARRSFQATIAPILKKYQYETLSPEDPVRKALTTSPGLYHYIGHQFPPIQARTDYGKEASFDYYFFGELDGLKELLDEQAADLELLSLGTNKLKVIPEGFFDEFNLKYLNLSDNQLKTLPKDLLKKLSNLKLICLSDNNLEALPEGFFNGLFELKEVYLQGNKFSYKEKKRIKAELEALGVKKIDI